MNDEKLSELLLKYKSNAESINDINFQTELQGMGDIKDITKFMKMINVINTFKTNANIATDMIKLLFDRLKEYELKPPCDECGFEGGNLYAKALENFNKNTLNF